MFDYKRFDIYTQPFIVGDVVAVSDNQVYRFFYSSGCPLTPEFLSLFTYGFRVKSLKTKES